ncbi:glycosyltransferase family 4 protein [Crenalkalicoccus roseus]|uniref:glycosyltransferase family 4 protein n=1 Tax=Crenalkalicoccus roseus TaxID=1485588 RepID=UPI00195C9528|nr:glycosyltransferase family 4 protein [Crenalkalicoccus roseus]
MRGMMAAPASRVLLVADAVGGVWSYTLDLARGIAERGGDAVLAVLGPPPAEDQREAAAAVPKLRMIETGLPLEWTAETPEALETTGNALAEMAAGSRADIVHLCSPALAAAERFGVPVIGVCHSCLATWWKAVRGGPPPAEFRWRIALTARGCAAVDALIAPTAAFAAATAEAYGLPQAPHVVRNGRQPPRTATSRQASFVFTAGRLWDEGKNLMGLDRAAARLAFPVLAAGSVEGPNGARVALRHVRPLGRLGEAEVRRWLARGPIFVSAARYEPFGLAVLEAAQAGCALVLSDIPSFRELWDGAALFVPPGDDAALAAALAEALRDRALRARLCGAARERAARYDAETMAEGILAIHRQVLQAAAERGSGRKSAA